MPYNYINMYCLGARPFPVVKMKSGNAKIALFCANTPYILNIPQKNLQVCKLFSTFARFLRLNK